MLSSYMVKNCVDVLKRHVWICVSFVYLTKQCQDRHSGMKAFTLVNPSVCRSLAKWRQLRHQRKLAFFKALALLKL
jgi:hypothetical protein